MYFSVVLPVYNNAPALCELATRLLRECRSITESFELIFVNDGSTDDSLQFLNELADSDHRIKVIALSRNFGQHPAISAGFEHANGQYIVLMDADLQDRPEDIQRLLAELSCNDCDVVYTLKQPDNFSLPTARLSSALYHFVFSRLVGSEVPLNIGTFRAFNHKVHSALLRFPEVNVLYGPLMFYIGFSSRIISLPFSRRPYGKSSYSLAKRIELASNSLMSYTDIPHRLTSLAGVLLLLGTLGYGLTVVIQYLLIGRSLPSGITVVILLICTLVGAVLFSLGIIGGYVFRIYQEVLRRPRYLVRSMRNISDHHQ